MRRWLALLGATLVLAGCTGIPDSSAPQVVRTVQRTPTAGLPRTHITPQPGEGPGDVVRDFVTAAVDADAGHSTSRQFLTNAAARRWQDNQTVVLDEVNVGDVTISGDSASVPVRGRRVGLLDSAGMFTPTLKRMGIGDEETFTFGLSRASGQWRIEQLQPGVLISASAFNSAYRPRRLYFFDATGKILVPDLRYSPLQGQALASWLLTQLLAGPRPELAQSVLNDVPDQLGKSSVQVGAPMVVDMPGTAQLEAPGLNPLAAQLAYTLSQGQFNTTPTLELTDSGKPVRVPVAPGLQFSTADFTSASPDSVVPEDSGAYFVRDGAVIDDSGAPLTNLLGQTARNFSSVALRRNPSRSLLVAGLTTSGQLVLGDDRRLAGSRLPQPSASRPEWRPFAEEVWLGAGGRGGIYRVGADEPARLVSITSQVGTLPSAPVSTLRFSPDGARIALVIRGADGVGGAWIGSVVTSGSDVRVDSLEPLTPPALAVTDLAWADSTKLQLVAAEPGAEARVWQVNSDGSKLDTLSNIGLPGPPTTITAALGQPTVVSAGGSIWSFTSGSSIWTSISGSSAPVAGANPIYAAP